MIGQMKDRINLVNPAKIPNGRGGWKIDETNAIRSPIWADFNRLNVNQQLRYNELETAADVQIIIRNNPALQQGTYVEHEGKKYNVVQFGPYSRPDFTEIRAREA
jgi:SPP1 family predicted phage head-tail adaptor